LYRGINDFKKGYQLRTNIVKDEKGDLITDSHSIEFTWDLYWWAERNIYGRTTSA